jgi:hypothetical protein
MWKVVVEDTFGATHTVLVRAGKARRISLKDRRASCSLDIDERGQMTLDAWWGGKQVRPPASIAPGESVEVGEAVLWIKSPPVVVSDHRKLARVAFAHGSPDPLTFDRAMLTFENMSPDVVRIVGLREDHTFEPDRARTTTLGKPGKPTFRSPAYRSVDA